MAAIGELRALASSSAELRRRLRDLAPVGYGQPSVCAGWSAFDLANHVVGGERRYLILLKGADAADVEPLRSKDHIGDDAASVYASHAQLLETSSAARERCSGRSITAAVTAAGSTCCA